MQSAGGSRGSSRRVPPRPRAKHHRQRWSQRVTASASSDAGDQQGAPGGTSSSSARGVGGGGGGCRKVRGGQERRRPRQTRRPHGTPASPNRRRESTKVGGTNVGGVATQSATWRPSSHGWALKNIHRDGRAGGTVCKAMGVRHRGTAARAPRLLFFFKFGDASARSSRGASASPSRDRTRACTLGIANEIVRCVAVCIRLEGGKHHIRFCQRLGCPNARDRASKESPVEDIWLATSRSSEKQRKIIKKCPQRNRSS